ncbi:hypothetical protein PILCRDRAFT_82179 [Piloderma croceum F 1598]|uniref:BAG domain-containing protein n=1 Tax=Piloderma croceum (strain F 1598) TaxID=765440 RepID=A0A0C3EWC7_PILCF|nr:hypothetical protein PILCRDRAFT_82179 [Piloderma croceum F 1598]
MSFVVKWGRDRLHFPLPPPDTKLAVIRRSLAEYTHLPELSFKLIHAGAVMKDDNAPISAYSIRENSTIALVGSAPVPITIPTQTHQQKARDREREKEPKTEQSTIAQIQAEVDRVRKTLLPGVDIFLAGLRGEDPSQPQTPTPTPTQEHTRLSELLLQSLLRLDAIQADGTWEAARLERKGAVREVQGLLERLDGGWVGSGSGRGR